MKGIGRIEGAFMKGIRRVVVGGGSEKVEGPEGMSAEVTGLSLRR